MTEPDGGAGGPGGGTGSRLRAGTLIHVLFLSSSVLVFPFFFPHFVVFYFRATREPPPLTFTLCGPQLLMRSARTRICSPWRGSEPRRGRLSTTSVQLTPLVSLHAEASGLFRFSHPLLRGRAGRTNRKCKFKKNM